MKPWKAMTLLFAAIFCLSMKTGETLSVTLSFDPTKDELRMNEVLISGGQPVSKVLEILGAANRKSTKAARAEVNYFYDSLGLVIISREDKLIGVGLTFTDDGDIHFSSFPFRGKLQLGTLQVSAATVANDFISLPGHPMICPMPSMCFSKDRSKSIQVTVGYIKDKARISQLSFMIK